MGAKKKTIFAAVKETTPGVFAADGATDAMAIVDISLSPKLEQVSREVMRNSLTALPSLAGKQTASFEVTVELRGSGVAGTPPEYDVLMESAWGIRRTVIGGTVNASPAPTTTALTVVGSGAAADLAVGDPVLVDVSATAVPKYEQVWIASAAPGSGEIAVTVTPPLSAAPTSVHVVVGAIAYKLTSDDAVRPTFSAYAYLDGGVKFSFAGCLCTMKMSDFAVGAVPKAVFAVEARSWTIEAASCAYTPSIDVELKPAVVLGASLQTNAGGAFAEEYVRNLEFDLGVGIVRREAIQAASGTHSMAVSERKVTGSINPYLDNVDHFLAWQAMTSLALHVKLADKLAAPNILALRLPQITRTDVGLEDADGVWAQTIPFDCGGVDDQEAFFGILKTPA